MELLLSPDCIVVTSIGELEHLRVMDGLPVTTTFIAVLCSGGSVDLLVDTVPVSGHLLC